MKMKHAIIGVLVLTVAALSPLCRAQSQLAGDWQGTISPMGEQKRFALHITTAKNGGLTATIDSPDEGVNGFPVTSVTLKDSKFSFSMDAVHSNYEGTVNKDTTEIHGILWSKDGQYELNWKRVAAQSATAPGELSQLVGDWQGIMDAGGTQLHIAVHFIAKDGVITSNFDNIDENNFGIPASSLTLKDSKLTVTLDTVLNLSDGSQVHLGGNYEGAVNKERTEITGTWTQSDPAHPPYPLNLKRAASAPTK
jgi:hypothetical protein